MHLCGAKSKYRKPQFVLTVFLPAIFFFYIFIYIFFLIYSDHAWRINNIPTCSDQAVKCKLLADIKYTILKTKGAIGWEFWQNVNTVMQIELSCMGGGEGWGYEECTLSLSVSQASSHSLKPHSVPLVIQLCGLYLSMPASKLVPFLLYSPLAIPFLSSSAEDFQGASKVFPCQTEYAQHIAFIYRIQYSAEKVPRSAQQHWPPANPLTLYSIPSFNWTSSGKFSEERTLTAS